MFGSDIYELLTDNFRFVMLHCLQMLESSYTLKKSYINRNDAICGISLILGHLIDADIKAKSEIVALADYETAFLDELNSEVVKQTLIAMLRPVYKKLAQKKWLWIQDIALGDLESDFFPVEIFE